MDIQKQLEQTIADFKSLDLAKHHLKNVEQRISDNHKKIPRLQAILNKEYEDIQVLKKLSMRALFEKILGNKEAQLEKERQEYLNAALNYNECIKSIELLQFEQELLQKKLKDYNTTKSRLHNLIRQRELSLTTSDKLAKQLIDDLNNNIDANIALKREIHEAIIVGKKTNVLFLQIIESLQQVERWGEYILLAPDAHIQKTAHINRVQDNAYKAKILLQEFEDELSDIYDKDNSYIQSNLKTFRDFIKSLHNNLITDWTISKRIKNTKNTSIIIKDKIALITQSLQQELIDADKTIEVLKDKKEKIIIELN